MPMTGQLSTGETHTDHESIGARLDWALAAKVGKRFARPGPATTAYTIAAAHAEITDAAARAEAPVREVTGLADGLRVPTTRVLDRKEWIDAASLSMQSMLGGQNHDVPEADTEPASRFAGIGRALDGASGKLGGLQAGGLLAFLSGAILGQYDPFTPDPDTGEPGVLMVVAPNVISVERALKVVPSDFRLWVCLHEVTHRVQFSANPWLRQYMVDNLEVLTADTGESGAETIARITEAVRNRGGAAGEKGGREKGVIGAMQMLQSPEQFDAFNRLMMLGTLLEGHADHVMDAVGPAHVPTVASIREAFDKRRTGARSPIQRIIRALIGMDAKMAQYIRGKAFVDEVVETVGMERFNAIWTSRDTMPFPAEIDEPQQWITRVL